MGDDNNTGGPIESEDVHTFYFPSSKLHCLELSLSTRELSEGEVGGGGRGLPGDAKDPGERSTTGDDKGSRRRRG